MHGTRLAERDGRSVDQRARPLRRAAAANVAEHPSARRGRLVRSAEMFSAGEQIAGVKKRKRREARKMKAVRLRVALTAALAAFLPATGGQVQAGAQDAHARAGGIE